MFNIEECLCNYRWLLYTVYNDTILDTYCMANLACVFNSTVLSCKNPPECQYYVMNVIYNM